MLNDLDAVARAARANGVGNHGEIHLGLRIPPVGDHLTSLLRQWRIEHPDVSITVHELPDHELSIAIHRRTLDVAFFAAYGAYPKLGTATLAREKLFAAVPLDHPLAAQDAIFWRELRDERVLVQDWEDSHLTREFYASLIGIGLPLQSHPASKQSILGLVAAGFGVTLVLESQAQVAVPGVAYRQILEENAKIDLVIAWAPDAEDATTGCFVSFMRDRALLTASGR
jgi:DNA-binding transcriptional LysR family regulator